MRQTRRLGCAGSSQPQSQTEAPRADGTHSSILFRRPFWGAVRCPVACSPWMDGVSWLRLLEKDRPGFGPCVAHWAENDAYPYLAPSQNETLRDHIWCEINTTWDMEFRTRTHARMPANAQRMLRGECCCCCWGKNPIHKITAQRTYT